MHSLCCRFLVEGRFALYLATACVRSTARPCNGATIVEGDNRDSVGSAERTESVDVSDAGSHRGDSDEGSRTRNYFFGPLTR
jgi:hypothetical protein